MQIHIQGSKKEGKTRKNEKNKNKNKREPILEWLTVWNLPYRIRK